MHTIKKIAFAIVPVLWVICSCNGQSPKNANHTPATSIIGGAFENKDWMYQGMPETITATDTSPGWNQNGQKILLTGTVYQADGKTPAAGVLLYYYHTNVQGRYLHQPHIKTSMPPNASGQTHGYIRGWVKTDSSGSYQIYTVMPGTYPTRDEPAHIHLSIKEPNGLNGYYADEFVFDNDPLLTTAKRKKLENRCGSGIMRMVQGPSVWIGERNIILGLHIPNYPTPPGTAQAAGLNIGDDQPSFIPYHAYGPDKGTQACPVCKYGRYHGILYFVGNHPNWEAIEKWLTYLEQESLARKQYLKTYFVYGNAHSYNKAKRQNELELLGKKLGIKNTALTFVPSFSDVATECYLNHLNPDAENTFIIYKNRNIIDTYINLAPTPNNFKKISETLDKTTRYFLLAD